MIPRQERPLLLTEEERRQRALCHLCKAWVILAFLLGIVVGISAASKFEIFDSILSKNPGHGAAYAKTYAAE